MNASTARTMLQTAARHAGAGKLEQAEAICRQIVQQRADDVDALHALARLLLATRRSAEALPLLQQAANLKRSSAAIRCDLAQAARNCGHFDEAEAAFRKALELQPSLHQARSGLGETLLQLGRHEEALAILNAALQQNPNDIQALDALAGWHSLNGRNTQAIELQRRAVQAAPRDAALRHNLAVSLEWQGQLDEAAAHYHAAIQLRPGWTKPHSNLLFLLTNSLDDPAALFAEHQRFARFYAAPLASRIQPHANDRDPNRRLRIAYLSADLCNHAVAIFLEPILRHHDPEKVEVYAYHDGDRTDEVTQRLRTHVHHWRDVTRVPNSALIEMIRQDAIDILIELSAHSNGGKRMLLLAQKPAPVQVTYLGYAGTTGLPTVDWRITDRFIDPPGQTEQYNSERLARLPHTQWVYQPPDEAPSVVELPALERGYVTFSSINRLNKITPRVLDFWADVLNAVPTSRMSFKARGMEDSGTQQLILDRFQSKGVSADRVSFSGYGTMQEYLAYFSGVDVVLDPFPFAGGTSTCHSLWMGVPVITLAGRTPVSRVGVSVLSNAGLAEFVAESQERYVEIARRCAADPAGLASLRRRLRQQMRQSPLCDPAGFTRDLEAACRDMWRHWCAAG